ncbi:MAG: alpha/beta hydrolase [Rickettsiales bacterium]|nr:alpha/beta hydrolase [Pseudomonadota bacterium]MDA0965489.1 alpha/beta hydrolase [Pseudomonadota bacterium]MDG4542813.1 alpha/beta hydrolase [Rickettsiales bacterium]MDG4544739.1 alpha/beta hydrolase [Rickettsiales bacterium]MDG4546861.1 alpha/beta hydrolase [Rickettsiales bacterium]
MPVKESFINIEEKHGLRKLAYTDWGNEDNKRVLVCVHGLSRNGRDFDFLAKSLEKDYRIICPDVAGRGNSDWLEDKKRYNYTTYVSDILILLENLGLQKIDWVGTSMGGIIGMIIASQKANLINKMVLNDIGMHISGKALDRIFDYVSIKPEFKSYEDAARNLKARMLTFGLETDEQWRHIFKYSIEENNGIYTFRYDAEIVQKIPIITRILGNIKSPRRIGKCPDVNLEKFWNKINCPVFVLRGEVSDILSDETYNKMLASKSQTQGAVIKGVGHAPMLMNDEQISYIGKWLA